MTIDIRPNPAKKSRRHGGNEFLQAPIGQPDGTAKDLQGFETIRVLQMHDYSSFRVKSNRLAGLRSDMPEAFRADKSLVAFQETGQNPVGRTRIRRMDIQYVAENLIRGNPVSCFQQIGEDSFLHAALHADPSST